MTGSNYRRLASINRRSRRDAVPSTRSTSSSSLVTASRSGPTTRSAMALTRSSSSSRAVATDDSSGITVIGEQRYPGTIHRPMKRLDLRQERGDLRNRLPRPEVAGEGPVAAVQEILAQVRERGD